MKVSLAIDIVIAMKLYNEFLDMKYFCVKSSFVTTRSEFNEVSSLFAIQCNSAIL